MGQEVGHDARPDDARSRAAQGRAIARQMVESFILCLGPPEPGDSVPTIEDLYIYWSDMPLVGGIDGVEPALMELLGDEDGLNRLGAAMVLLLFEKQRALSISTINVLLNHFDNEILSKTLCMISLINEIPCEFHDNLTVIINNSKENRLVLLAAACLRCANPASLHVLRNTIRCSDDVGLVLIAANALARSGFHTDEAINALVDALKRAEEPMVRMSLVTNIGSSKERAKGAEPTLLKLLDDPNTDTATRRAIVGALGKIGPSDAAKRALLRRLRSKDWVIVCVIAQSFQFDIGEMPEAVIEALARLLDHSDADARCTAAKILGEIGPTAAMAVPHMMRRAIVEQVPDVLVTLANSINRIRKPFKSERTMFEEESYDKLIERARFEAGSDDRRTYLLAVSAAIAGFGPAAIPDLIKLIKSDSILSTQVASICFISIAYQGQVSEVIQAITDDLLNDEDAHIRQIGVAVLSELGKDAEGAVPALAQLLDNNDEEVFAAVFLALQVIGVKAGRAAPALARLLHSDDYFLIPKIEQTLLALGAAAIPALEAELTTASGEVQRRVAALLKQIGQPAVADRKDSLLDKLTTEKHFVLLEQFAEVGKILRANGATSDEEMAATLASKQEKGLISESINTSASGIRKRRDALEKILTEKEGRPEGDPVRLTNRDSTRKGGLSDYGETFLVKVLALLDAHNKNS